MSRNTFIGILVAILLVAGGFWLFGGKDSGGNGQSAAQPSQHIESEGSTGVVFVEYGDFQCSACGNYYPLLKQLRAQYVGKVSFQFRSFPIISKHPHAMAAHRAAEAAGKQGKFFEMHDMLYETQTSWTNLQAVQPVFENYARQLGLDIEKYRQDLASQEVANVINADIQEGQKLEVQGTPTFFIDGRKYETEQFRTLDDIIKAIEEAIKAKTAAQQ